MSGASKKHSQSWAQRVPTDTSRRLGKLGLNPKRFGF
jgi:hypothetical protein